MSDDPKRDAPASSTIPLWETVGPHTMRLRAPGGWLYHVRAFSDWNAQADPGPLWPGGLVFVPDPPREWQINLPGGA